MIHKLRGLVTKLLRNTGRRLVFGEVECQLYRSTDGRIDEKTLLQSGFECGIILSKVGEMLGRVEDYNCGKHIRT